MMNKKKCFSRAFVKEKPLKPPIPAGGFLCDEMGLGKTVEVLTTVLLNPKPKSRAEVMMERNERKLFDSLVVCCFCGSNPNEKPLIQCQKCLKCQHVSCVNWDDNWDFAEYFCPHCVVLEVSDQITCP